jgi:hypothetical protein
MVYLGIIKREREMNKSTETAEGILDTATKLGWVVVVRNTILTIYKEFTAGDMDEFVSADMEYYSILGKLPSTSPGSVWGTDGGGIGAISAVNSGVFTMNKSGGNKLVLKALKKIL